LANVLTRNPGRIAGVAIDHEDVNALSDDATTRAVAAADGIEPFALFAPAEVPAAPHVFPAGDPLARALLWRLRLSNAGVNIQALARIVHAGVPGLEADTDPSLDGYSYKGLDQATTWSIAGPAAFDPYATLGNLELARAGLRMTGVPETRLVAGPNLWEVTGRTYPGLPPDHLRLHVLVALADGAKGISTWCAGPSLRRWATGGKEEIEALAKIRADVQPLEALLARCRVVPPRTAVYVSLFDREFTGKKWYADEAYLPHLAVSRALVTAGEQVQWIYDQDPSWVADQNIQVLVTPLLHYATAEMVAQFQAFLDRGGTVITYAGSALDGKLTGDVRVLTGPYHAQANDSWWGPRLWHPILWPRYSWYDNGAAYQAPFWEAFISSLQSDLVSKLPTPPLVSTDPAQQIAVSQLTDGTQNYLVLVNLRLQEGPLADAWAAASPGQRRKILDQGVPSQFVNTTGYVLVDVVSREAFFPQHTIRLPAADWRVLLLCVPHPAARFAARPGARPAFPGRPGFAALECFP
jgi:hypothetical protein